MLFYIFSLTYCISYEINLTETPQDFLILYLEPFDYYSIHVRDGVSTILSEIKREDHLLVEVESINSRGESIEHESFDRYSRLYAIFFKNRNYTVKFTNEGHTEIQLGIVFSDEYFKDEVILRKRISPKFDFNFPGNYSRQLTQNFNFNAASSNSQYIYSCVIFLVFIDLIIIVFYSCVCCKCCCYC